MTGSWGDLSAAGGVDRRQRGQDAGRIGCAIRYAPHSDHRWEAAVLGRAGGVFGGAKNSETPGLTALMEIGHYGIVGRLARLALPYMDGYSYEPIATVYLARRA